MSSDTTTVEEQAGPAGEDGHSPDISARELMTLAQKIGDVFYAQISTPRISTPAEVCDAFCEILNEHWGLQCCLLIYLVGEGATLYESAATSSDSVDGRELSRAGEMIARAIERDGIEIQAGLEGGNARDADGDTALRQLLDAAELRSAVGIPIHALGRLAGALVVVTSNAEALHAALDGLRFLAEPVVIAVGNARRTEALREQHTRIQALLAELQERSKALEEANRELRRVAQYRSLFLSRMSHDLRTPLTSMLGFAEILIDHENLTETQRRYCERIQSSGKQLQISLDQLVDLSRLETGHTELFLHEFPLREVLRESSAAVARLARKQGVEITFVPESADPTIVSDEGKLRQVLYNFLAFAISRSPSGAVVRVGVTDVNAGEFQITIEDHGPAMTDLAAVFEPVQIDAPTESPTSMNELGLVIARRLVTLLGGKVRLESPPEGGLCVSLQLLLRPTKLQGN